MPSDDQSEWQWSSPTRSYLDQRRQIAVPGSLELAGVLAQLGRDRLVAEEAVELLLVREPVHLAGLDHRDAVLGDRQAAALGLLAERDVVILRSREVLEQAAVVLGRHDTQVEPHPLLRHDGRLRVAPGCDLEHPGQRDEVRDQRRGVGRRCDHVEVAERLTAAAHAAGARDLDRRGVRAKLVHDLAYDRQPDTKEAAPLRLRAEALREGLEDPFLALRAESLERADALLLGRLAELVERRHAELAPDPRRGLGAEPREPQELTHLRRHLGAPLLERGHRAGLGHLDDFRLDRRADPRELLRRAL